MIKPKSLTMEDMNFEPVFKTEKGSIYYFDEEKALWLRIKYCGQICTHEVYFGSKPYVMVSQTQIYENCQLDTRPNFKYGHIPFGLAYLERWLSLRDMIILEGTDRLNWRFNVEVDVENIGRHVAHNIVKVYKNINPLDYISKG